MKPHVHDGFKVKPFEEWKIELQGMPARRESAFVRKNGGWQTIDLLYIFGATMPK